MKTDCPIQCDGKHCKICQFSNQLKLNKETKMTTTVLPDTVVEK